MLDVVFMKILDMTLVSSLVILAVAALRGLLKKAPKSISYALWAVVLFRLLCPVSFQLPVSLIPEVTSVSNTYALADEPISVGGAAVAAYRLVGDVMNGGLGVQHVPTTQTDALGMTHYVHADSWDVVILAGQYLWLLGVLAMLIHSAVSYIRIRRKLACAVWEGEGVWIAEGIDSAFVMGLWKPRIYLPAGLTQQERDYVLLHERHHIRRGDPVLKALGFLALCLHWFNPLVWLAFTLACRDMEMSCDEAVVRRLGPQIRADYAASLLNLATDHRIISGTPLAFGEADPKGRIRNLAAWRKPAIWVVVLAVALCLVVGICLLADPVTDRVQNPAVQEYTPGMEGILGSVESDKYELVSLDFAMGADRYGRAVFKDPHKAFATMRKKMALGLALIAEEFDLAPISHDNYEIYKKYGWQTTSGTEEAREQARFISGFLDIYENSFDPQPPNTDQPPQTSDTSPMLTFADVAAFSGKGMALTWEDLPGSGKGDAFSAAIGTGFALQAERGEDGTLLYAVLVCLSNRKSVDIRTGDVTRFLLDNGQAQMDALLEEAIAARHDGETGEIHVFSWHLIAREAVSGTPAVGQTDPVLQEKQYLQLLYQTFHANNGSLEAFTTLATPALAVFSVSQIGEYRLQVYAEPVPGAQYAQDMAAFFPKEVRQKLDAEAPAILDALEQENLRKAQVLLGRSDALNRPLTCYLVEAHTPGAVSGSSIQRAPAMYYWGAGSFVAEDAPETMTVTVDGVSYTGSYAYSITGVGSSVTHEYYVSPDPKEGIFSEFAVRAVTRDLAYINRTNEAFFREEEAKAPLEDPVSQLPQIAWHWAEQFIDPDLYTLRVTTDAVSGQEDLRNYHYTFVATFGNVDTTDRVVIRLTNRGSLVDLEVGPVGWVNARTEELARLQSADHKAIAQKALGKEILRFEPVRYCLTTSGSVGLLARCYVEDNPTGTTFATVLIQPEE